MLPVWYATYQVNYSSGAPFKPSFGLSGAVRDSPGFLPPSCLGYEGSGVYPVAGEQHV